MSHKHHGIVKIVSGGQTGVDRAALDAAITLGIEHGGWCPQGRLAEDGRIDDRYQLQEMATADYAERTERNVIDSDGTLILYHRKLQGGTLLTNRLAKRHGKPLHRVRLDRLHSARPLQSQTAPERRMLHATLDWIHEHGIGVLNVAGPRGSSHPEIGRQAFDFLCKMMKLGDRLPLS